MALNSETQYVIISLIRKLLIKTSCDSESSGGKKADRMNIYISL